MIRQNGHDLSRYKALWFIHTNKLSEVSSEAQAVRREAKGENGGNSLAKMVSKRQTLILKVMSSDFIQETKQNLPSSLLVNTCVCCVGDID